MDRCDTCRHITNCAICNKTVNRLAHIGVRGTTSQLRVPILGTRITYDSQQSGVWHYAQPCQHRLSPYAPTTPTNIKYNGGPLWQDGYSWQNIYLGSFYRTANTWIQRVQKATIDIEKDPSYSGGLTQYNVGMGKVNISPIIIAMDPPSPLTDAQIQNLLAGWIIDKVVPDLSGKGAYNIFLPPNMTATLSGDKSCSTFCDYHSTVNGPDGPFYTVEPYPCSQGCNQCTNDPFNTLTQGLSEEMVELKTDMDPGTGWVIGNEEICDFCDTNFVCNRISHGEYVNSWYDMSQKTCWRGR